MRKNSPRKWLHACLDLLPVILIPVFMIYSHRHEINDGVLQVPQKEVVDFNQLVKNNDFIDNQNWDVGVLGSYITFDDDLIYVSTSGNVFYNLVAQNVNLVGGHIYYCSTDCIFYSSGSIAFGLFNDGGWSSGMTKPITTVGKMSFITGAVTNETRFGLMPNISNATELTIDYVNVVDLTQMFGSGNEPSLEQFNSWYDNHFYSYTLSHKELLQVGSTTFNDTDIMSQFTYQLYNAVDKYFNMGNVFNMNGVYDWFNLNIFGGNAPISIYIVWNIVLYEFVMDLLFLLYGLFMWFIDMVEHIMDKPFKSIK